MISISFTIFSDGYPDEAVPNCNDTFCTKDNCQTIVNPDQLGQPCSQTFSMCIKL